MNLYKTRLITGLIGYGLIGGAIVAGVLHYLQQAIDWNWFLAILLFFLVLESFIISFVVSNSQNKDKKKLVNIYMLTKVIKIVLSLVFGLVYVMIERTNDLKIFIIIYIVFYLLFLISETFIFSKIEKHIKTQNKDE